MANGRHRYGGGDASDGAGPGSRGAAGKHTLTERLPRPAAGSTPPPAAVAPFGPSAPADTADGPAGPAAVAAPALSADESFVSSLGVVQRKAAGGGADPADQPAQGVRPATGVDLAFFFTGGDSFGKAARAYVEAYYPDHLRFECRSFEHMFSLIGTEVARAVKAQHNTRGHVDEIIIVSHANAKGGMKIPLTEAKGSSKFTPQSLKQLQDETIDEEATAHRGFMKARDQAMVAIDEHTKITIRGCEIGQSQDALEALRVMFGGDATVIAPTEFQGFQIDEVGAPGARFQTWDEAWEMLRRNGYLGAEALDELTADEMKRAAARGPDEVLKARKAKYMMKRFPAGVPTEFFLVGEADYKAYKAMTRKEKLGDASERVKHRLEDELEGGTRYPDDRNAPFWVNRGDTEERDGRDAHWAASSRRTPPRTASERLPHDQIIAAAEALVADWRAGHGVGFLELYDVWQLPDVTPSKHDRTRNDLEVDTHDVVRKTPSVFGPDNLRRALDDAYQHPDREKDAWRSETVVVDPKADTRGIDSYRSEGLEDMDAASQGESTENGFQVLGDDRLILWGFASNASRMTAAHDQALVDFIATVGEDDLVTVDGHTDSVGTVAANLRLSRHRAENVAAALSQRGMAHERIRVDGKGPSQPLATETGDRAMMRDARARNRRVELLRTPGWLRVDKPIAGLLGADVGPAGAGEPERDELPAAISGVVHADTAAPRRSWPKYGDGRAEFFKGVDPASGVRLYAYKKNVAEPDGNQARALQTLAMEHADMVRKGDKRRIVIEGHASRDEKGGVSQARAEAVRKILHAKGVDDRYIIDVADYGSTRPRADDQKGRQVDEEKAKLNRYVNVRFETAMEYGGTAPDDVEQERRRKLARDLPPRGGDPDETVSKADVGRSVIMMVDEVLLHSRWLGLANVVIEPLLAWLNVLGAIDELKKSRARFAYRDGANHAAGHGVAQAYAGKGRIDYSELTGRVSDARRDTRYTPLDPRDAEAAFGRGVVAVAGGSYTDRGGLVTLAGIWNPAMEEAERQTRLKLYDQLRAQGRKVDDADAIYPKIIDDVRIHVAGRLSDEIRKALDKV